MHMRLIHVDLSEASHPFTSSLCGLPVYEETETALEFDIVFERNLGARKQADRYVWFSHTSKTPRDRVGELCCHQFIPDFG
jgi:hypothetical protein